MKKLVAALLLVLALGGSAFAVDWTSHGGGIRPGNIILNGGMALGTWEFILNDDTALGFAVSGDFALPVYALTLGLETGYQAALDVPSDVSAGKIPIALRLGWHPNFGVSNLDTYIQIKLGMGIGTIDASDVDGGVGFLGGFDVGARYFFYGKLGAFTELGFDGVRVKYKKGSTTWAKMFYSGIFTFGLTYKI
ncbi:MAG: hypothetical protein LBR99_05845 [Treponema sp.]|jgi:hypothetical protein|nr:hypothetical protein [Treponema sp.]